MDTNVHNCGHLFSHVRTFALARRKNVSTRKKKDTRKVRGSLP